MGIHDYYKEKYNKESKFLAYGADIHEDYDISLLAEFGLQPRKYYLLVARLEPENNIEMAIQGFLASGETDRTFHEYFRPPIGLRGPERGGKRIDLPFCRTYIRTA